MIFSFILLVVILVAFFIIKGRTFDRLSDGGQLLVVLIASIATAVVLTMQMFISGRRVLTEFVQAVEGIPSLAVWGSFLLILFGSYIGMRWLGKLNLTEIRRLLKEEIWPKQRSLMKDTWEKLRSMVSKER